MSARSPVVAAGSVCGAAVTDRAGEKLGTIEELMLDGAEGRIVYAVLAYGGVLGVGEKLFGVPWSSLIVDAETGGISIDVERRLLDEEPGLDKDAWPPSVGAEWWRER